LTLRFGVVDAKASMTNLSVINVAVTGALSEPRARIAELIDATSNGKFVEDVNLATSYLVCEKHDSKKAKKAAKYGTTVIGEAELREILKANTFPDVALPDYTPHHPNNFPLITWTHVYEPPKRFLLTYEDVNGHRSIRTIVATGTGSDGRYDYLGGYDGPTFKTFRNDRIIEKESA
jgi:hypothetical protein